jgi:uncharacterized protein (TIGR03032 family)
MGKAKGEVGKAMGEVDKAKTPATKAKTPATKAKTPATKAKTPATKAKTPATKAKGGGQKRKIVLQAAPRSGASLYKKILELDSNLLNSFEVIWDPNKLPDVGEHLLQDPGTLFVFVTRHPIPTISSISDGWRDQKNISNTELPGWWGEKWSYALTGNWQELIGKPLVTIATAQYQEYLDDLIHEFENANKKSGRAALSCFEDLLSDPNLEIERICKLLDIDFQGEIPTPLPKPANSKTPPGSEKVRRNISEIGAQGKMIQEIQKLERDFRIGQGLKPAEFKLSSKPLKKEEAKPSSGTPFQSSHSLSMAKILRTAKASLVITTYKSGQLILVRAEKDEPKLTTSFKRFNRPMGVAARGSRLSVGTGDSIINYSHQPGLKSQIDPTDKPDRIYSLRSMTHSGDIAIHEMDFDVNGDLWFVNTKFSCLSKQQLNFSFNCEWKPEWITELAAEDRCHLNGLAMVDGQPRYVTTLSQTNTPNGWREHKGSSGTLIDIKTNRVVASNLSMPHSPRWYQNKLWLLESGKGSLVTVDIETGSVETIIELQGFTRGLAFLGPYAFVGLSQVRETIFKELPLTASEKERNCGVWAIDLRTREVAGFIKFEGVVQELFDVQVLPNTTWPMFLDGQKETANSFVLDNETLRLVKQAPPSGV